MTDYEKLNNLMHLADRAMTTCHYARAEKLFRQLLQEAFETRNNKIIAGVSIAFLNCRRRHILSVLHDFKRIDPIQQLQKELS